MRKVRKTHIIFLLFFVVAAIITCCSPKNNFKTLSFFFDGVPKPVNSDSLANLNNVNKADTSANKAPVKTVNKMLNFVHQPYKEKNCEVCHDQKAAGMYTSSQPKLCYTCHEDFSKKFAFVHGPVAGGFCTDCHNPHSSEFPKLLKRKGQDLCLYCHDAGTVLKNEVHTTIGETDCTECHNPHGGSENYIFK
jgi:predicted CXXCH cytochrome family protein